MCLPLFMARNRVGYGSRSKLMYSMLRAYRVRALTVAFFSYSRSCSFRKQCSTSSNCNLNCSCFPPVGSKPDDGTVLPYFFRDKILRLALDAGRWWFRYASDLSRRSILVSTVCLYATPQIRRHGCMKEPSHQSVCFCIAW